MFLAYFLISFFVSILATFLVILLMQKMKIFDRAKTKKRKIHKKDIPLGGGLAIFFSSFLLIFILFFLDIENFNIDISNKHILALFLGSVLIMIGGLLDDKYDLSPKKQIIFPILAALIIIIFGIGPQEITNPFGGVLRLDLGPINIFGLNTIFTLSGLLVFIWLMLMMYSTKFLDGVDGLATSIVFIGAIVLFFLSLEEKWFDLNTAFLAIIFAGSCLGFLVWNANPAKIFLGEGGSIFLGFFLGVLAIISGAKIATTLLVMAIPIIDVLRVIIIRLKNKKSIFEGDNEHIHHQFLKKKYSQKQTVFILSFISILFALSALYFQTRGRILIFLFLLFTMLLTLFIGRFKKI